MVGGPLDRQGPRRAVRSTLVNAHSQGAVSSITLYRRAPHIVCYWKHGRFLFHNYATGTRAGASALACSVLDFFTHWRPLRDLLASNGDAEPDALHDLVSALVAANLLQRSDQPPKPEETAMSKMDRWNPEAGFFHSATKDVKFIDQKIARQQLRRQAEQWPMPAPIKRYSGAATIPLEPPDTGTDIARALLARRSWRRFGKGKIPLTTFGSLLGLTAGVQQWVTVPPAQKMALKTSPSGGARHPVEVYTLAWGIQGLKAGLYHYVADTHELELVRAGLDSRRVPSYIPYGEYWSGACAVIIFSAVYDRDLWRYPYSRAYRAPLIEAGHLCQTFCLLASSYGLAPFCAMGLADTAIERDLAVDGISESVLYIAGVGIRPKGLHWAPAPDGFGVPYVETNPYLQSRSPKGRAAVARTATRARRPAR